jgi:predicted nucleic acid-binding protein
MSKTVYDTRFFAQFYYSKDGNLLRRLKEEKRQPEKYVSTIVVHELYSLTLEREGRETARLRTALLKQEFTVAPVTSEIAELSAEFRHKHDLSMGDSMIAATASSIKATCFSDDQHFKRVKEIKTAWI